MSQTLSRPPASRQPSPDWPEQRSQPDVVEAWLRRELARLHDEVLREPVPAELLRLIEAG